MARRLSQKIPSPRGVEPEAGKKHILAIRLSALGDVAMLVPVLRVATETYPELKITVLTRKFFKPLFEGIRNVSFYEADVSGVHAGVTGLSRLAKELRDLEIDAVADLHDVLRSNVLKTVFCFYGIPVEQINKGRKEKKALTASNNKIFKPLKPTHERYADVFAALGFPVDLSTYAPPPKERFSPELQKRFGKEIRKWVGIAPFAQHNSKVYPTDLLEEVLSLLSKEENIRIFLFGGGKSEKAKLELLEEKYPLATSVAGKFSFKEEIVLISHLDVMLSMDSGNAHLAAIYGIPVITLWGVTHPYAGFQAFGQPDENSLLPDLRQFPAIPTSVYGNKVPAGYEKAIRTINPDRIVKRIKEVL